MTFVHGSRLLLLLTLLPLGILCVFLGRMRKEALAQLGLPYTRPFSPAALACVFLASALFMGALSKPVGGFHDDIIYRPGKDVLFLLDVSLSMTATDSHPSRLETAKRKLLDAARITRQSSRLDRLGIILFSGNAYMFCPPTADYDMFRSFVSEISPSLTTSLGTNIRDALVFAVHAVHDLPARRAQLVLISDGDDPACDADGKFIESYSDLPPVDVIGIGTPQGAEVVQSVEMEREGRAAITPLNAGCLRAVASATRGRYEWATLDDADIREFLHMNLPVSELPRKVRSYNDFGPIFSLVAFLLGAAFLRLQRTYLLSLLITGALTAAAPSAWSEETGNLHDAYVAYEQGSYERALRIFSTYTAYAPDDRKIRTAVAGTLFKTGKYREALRIYTGLLNGARSGRERFELFYNAGNCHFALEEYPEAVAAFEAALEIKEDDERARFNRDLAQEYLEARMQASPPEQAGSENEREVQEAGNADETRPGEATPTPSPLGSGDKGNLVRETSNRTEELRLLPSLGGDSPQKQRAPSWLEALPDSPLLPEKNKDAPKPIPEHWW